MQKFTIHTGVAAPLIRDNIDTDAIIPSREMKTVSKLGLGEGLFAAWRYDDEKARLLNPGFVLNRTEYNDASILLAGSNFGCGSSREHAVWALQDFGIRCVIASSFGSIFARNCVRNGLLPLELGQSNIQKIADQVSSNPQQQLLKIDLTAKLITGEQELALVFDLPDRDQEMLLQGLDQISMTKQLGPNIDAYQQRDKDVRPWVY